MQKLGWRLMALCMLVGACEKDEPTGAKAPPVPAGGDAGAPGSAGSQHGIELGIGGGPVDTGATGGHPGVDLGRVPMPVVRCGDLGAGGAVEGDAGSSAGGGQSGETMSAGGAPWDETCAPPPSTCLDNVTLVYFDEGECLSGSCDWHKRSLDCLGSCVDGGCQDSITTK
jgi:hypothetical protein